MKIDYCLKNESFKYIKGEKVSFDNSTISLATARRDWAAFQILLYGTEDFTVSTGDNPYFCPAGPLTNIRVKAELEGFDESLLCIHPIGMIEDDDGIEKSDILLNNEVISVKERETQCIWVEIKITKEIKAGIYKGRICLYSHSMFNREELCGTMKFELQVRNVILPEPGNKSFYLDLWQHLSNIARKHEVRLWSDEHFEVIEKYVETLAELGQKTITIIASEIPWSGQRCFKYTDYLSDYFEYSMIKVMRSLEGTFSYDYSVIERYVELCGKYGIKYEIEVFGLINIWTSPEDGYEGVAPDFPEAIRIRYLDISDGCYKYMDTSEDIIKYISALEQFFLDKGWIEKVRIVADEPADIIRYKKMLKLISDIAPHFRFKTAINHVEFINEFKDKIDDFVPILTCACEEWDLLKKIKENIKGKLLWYVCWKPQIPNTFIASPLLEARLIPILTAYMNFDGFLRWNYTAWPENPRRKMSYHYPIWKAGDTNFVYPAPNGSPLLTLRYKNLKRGIEDFELIKMLRNKKSNSEAILKDIMALVLRTEDIRDLHTDKAIPSEKLYSLSYNDYQNCRIKLLDNLE